MMRRRRYRIYLRYYAGGDLESALGWKNSMYPGQYRANRPSEIFIWHIFRSLARAVGTMQSGHFDPNARHHTPGWRPVTHLDIGLRNVFIEEPRNANTTVSF